MVVLEGLCRGVDVIGDGLDLPGAVVGVGQILQHPTRRVEGADPRQTQGLGIILVCRHRAAAVGRRQRLAGGVVIDIRNKQLRWNGRRRPGREILPPDDRGHGPGRDLVVPRHGNMVSAGLLFVEDFKVVFLVGLQGDGGRLLGGVTGVQSEERLSS